MDNKKRVEAILFTVGKEITVERISSLSSLSPEEVEHIMTELQAEYNQRDHSLQIVKKEDGWKLTVRDEFIPLVSSIVTSTELERPLMETLAVIAWRYPILQSDVIKLRSPAAYEHMRLLEEQCFIKKEKYGRTFRVKLTKKFFNYFDLPSEEAKQAFLKNIPSEVLQEAEEVDKEADEIERLIDLEEKNRDSQREIKAAMGQVVSTETTEEIEEAKQEEDGNSA